MGWGGHLHQHQHPLEVDYMKVREVEFHVTAGVVVSCRVPQCVGPVLHLPLLPEPARRQIWGPPAGGDRWLSSEGE